MIELVSIEKVTPDPNQPRKVFDPSHISGLAKSLEVEGMINPIEVDRNYQIITGECRWRAAKEVGWGKVPVNVNKSSLTEYERFRRQMSENLHQSAAGGSSPMNAIDVAKGYKRMIEMKTKKDYEPGSLSRSEVYGLIKEVVAELGVGSRTVYDYLALLEQPKYVLEDIKKGTPRTFYREIERAPEKYREPLKQAVVRGEIVARDTIKRFSRLAKAKPEKAEIELLRITKKQSEEANRILNRAVELSLALKATDPDKLSLEDRKMIQMQLGSTANSIRRFLGRLKN